MRRLMEENWFQIVIRVGSTGHDEHTLTMKKLEPWVCAAPTKPEPCAGAAAKWLGTFTANNAGEVFLFVNDAVIGLSWRWPVDYFYHDSAGEARVTIQPDPLMRLPEHPLEGRVARLLPSCEKVCRLS